MRFKVPDAFISVDFCSCAADLYRNLSLSNIQLDHNYHNGVSGSLVNSNQAPCISSCSEKPNTYFYLPQYHRTFATPAAPILAHQS